MIDLAMKIESVDTQLLDTQCNSSLLIELIRDKQKHLTGLVDTYLDHISTVTRNLRIIPFKLPLEKEPGVTLVSISPSYYMLP